MSFEARQCKYCGKEFPTGLKCAKHIFKEHRCELNVVEVGADVEASEEEDLGDADDLMLVVKTEPISAEEEDS